MSLRRAEYKEGAGLLATGAGRLFFVVTDDHPCSAVLVNAACNQRPLRALEAAVARAASDVPPFVYVEAGSGIRGIVCGEIQVEVTDIETSVVDGTSAEPWAQLSGSTVATVAAGGQRGNFDNLWVESGVVRASAFRWAPRRDSRTPLACPSVTTQRTLDTPAKTSERPTEFEPATTTASEQATPQKRDREAAARGSGPDVTALPDRTVDALVCLDCDGLNPPMTARCRSCNALLSGANSEVRSVAQPPLGVIHLSGGRVEPVDAHLLIGRNPARYGIRPHQREVVHGMGDQSVSRLHIELVLDGWAVKAITRKRGPGTTIETRFGGSERLRTGVPRQLNSGDTIHFGTVWIRYEEGASVSA